MIKMKDSGIPWIGQIPEDWEVKRLKSILHERNEKNNPLKTTKILSLTNDRGVIPYDEKGLKGNNAKEDLTAYKIVNINDIVVNSMNVIIGSVGLSKYYGAVSPVYYMLYCDQTQNINFYNYIFSTKEFQKMLVGYGNGILEIRMRIPMSNLNNILLPIPSLTVQQKIVEILDKKCGQIDELVSLEENEIEKLKEYKTSLITKVVTKGLDHNAKMKDSGIPWIGQIPEDWKVGRLKNFYDVWGGTTPSTENIGFWNGNIKWATPIDFKENYIYDTLKKITKLAIEKNNLKVAHENTLILTTRAPIGKIAITKAEMTCNQGCKILFSKNKVFYRYTYYYLLAFCNILNVLGTGTTFLEISSTNLSNFNHLFLRLEIQQQIVEYLDKRCEEIDNLIKIKQEKIEKLKEYKKSLIYQYVTGKKEV